MFYMNVSRETYPIILRKDKNVLWHTLNLVELYN